MAAPELHIASLVVHAMPSRIADVHEAVSRVAGALVHASTPEGKLIVTLEQPSAEAMADGVQRIQRMRGVLSASLVYQCADTLQSMNEEIDDAQA